MKEKKKISSLNLNKKVIGSLQSTNIVGGTHPGWGSCPATNCNCPKGGTNITCPPDPYTPDSY